MENRENGRMILDSVLNGPLVWPTSLPPDVYAILNHHKVAKEICDRVKLFMHGTKLSLQEKECKLYDEFDKFSFVKGETMYQYYWIFAQLINNMNVINMSMRPVQVNTKNLNSLPPEWSKFMTYVKLARDLHTTNYDQLYSYLEQHEAHVNETRLIRLVVPVFAQGDDSITCLNKIQALVDKKKVIITKTSIRSDLQLEDAEGTECLPNATIFEQLTLMGAKTNAWNEFSSTMASTVICHAINQKFNFSKYIFDNMVKNLEGGVKFLMYPRAGKSTFVRVKKLEGKRKSKPIGMKRLFKTGRSAQVVSSKDEGLGDQEDASKQGRKIADIDADAEVTLVDETQGRNDEEMFDIGILDGEEVFAEQDVVEKETLIEIKAAKPKARGVIVQEPREFTTTTSPLQPSQLPQAKDKGKEKTVEPKKLLKKKDQIMFDKEVAQKLQAQLDAELEDEEKLARQREEDVNIAEWDNVQAMMDADYELATRLQAEEQGELTIKKVKDYENVEAEVDDDQEEAEMKKHMEIVPDDESIDREDLETLWKLVKAKHRLTRPEEAYERVLWGDLKVMFEPNVESTVWEESTRTQSDSLEAIFFKWSTFYEISESVYLYASRKEISTYTCNNHINAQQEALG
ncbi:hypothetical protein Tco_0439297 [Tanacetum coccineum]